MQDILKRGFKAMSRSQAFNAFAAMVDRFGDSRSNLLRVLTYHRVDHFDAKPHLNPVTLSTTPEEFERQMQYLSSHCRVVGMEEVMNATNTGTPLPPRSVLITFDDAYRDFQKNAWPILQANRLPVTLFVPTAFPDQPNRLFWWDQLYQCVYRKSALRAIPSPLGQLPVSTENERRRTLQQLTQHYHSLAAHDAESFLADLCTEGIALPPEGSVLSWDELRALARSGITLGAHTRTHPLLNRLSLDEAGEEIVGSREDLEREVGNVAPILAYPGGAFTADVSRLAAENGFRLAFTTCRGVNDLETADPLRLRRINVGRSTSLSLLKLELRPGFLKLNPLWSRSAVGVLKDAEVTGTPSTFNRPKMRRRESSDLSVEA